MTEKIKFPHNIQHATLPMKTKKNSVVAAAALVVTTTVAVT
jgi:hypothetical protein